MATGGNLGLPPASAIVHQRTFVPPSTRATRARPPARSFRILRTTETDPYDDPVPAALVPQFGARAAAAPRGDAFKGTARRAAKISIAAAETEVFEGIGDLLVSLPADADMVGRDPPIATAKTSDRVAQEQRDVRLGAFLYAASREDDNDFHLIIGIERGTDVPVYLNVELSGLPPKSSPHHPVLKEARRTFGTFLGSDLPGMTYDYYDPPIPLTIEGSLFFDMSHAHGSKPGPQSLRDNIPTIWEVHPVSGIVFEP